jgi:hypothetical protein
VREPRARVDPSAAPDALSNSTKRTLLLRASQTLERVALSSLGGSTPRACCVAGAGSASGTRDKRGRRDPGSEAAEMGKEGHNNKQTRQKSVLSAAAAALS